VSRFRAVGFHHLNRRLFCVCVVSVVLAHARALAERRISRHKPEPMKTNPHSRN